MTGNTWYASYQTYLGKRINVLVDYNCLYRGLVIGNQSNNLDLLVDEKITRLKLRNRNSYHTIRTLEIINIEKHNILWLAIDTEQLLAESNLLAIFNLLPQSRKNCSETCNCSSDPYHWLSSLFGKLPEQIDKINEVPSVEMQLLVGQAAIDNDPFAPIQTAMKDNKEPYIESLEAMIDDIKEKCRSSLNSSVNKENHLYGKIRKDRQKLRNEELFSQTSLNQQQEQMSLQQNTNKVENSSSFDLALNGNHESLEYLSLDELKIIVDLEIEDINIKLDQLPKPPPADNLTNNPNKFQKGADPLDNHQIPENSFNNTPVASLDGLEVDKKNYNIKSKQIKLNTLNNYKPRRKLPKKFQGGYRQFLQIQLEKKFEKERHYVGLSPKVRDLSAENGIQPNCGASVSQPNQEEQGIRFCQNCNRHCTKPHCEEYLLASQPSCSSTTPIDSTSNITNAKLFGKTKWIKKFLTCSLLNFSRRSNKSNKAS